MLVIYRRRLRIHEDASGLPGGVSRWYSTRDAAMLTESSPMRLIEYSIDELHFAYLLPRLRSMPDTVSTGECDSCDAESKRSCAAH